LHSTTRVECILPKFEGGFAPEGTDPRESGNDYAPGKEGPQPLNSATAQRRRIPKCSVRMGWTGSSQHRSVATRPGRPRLRRSAPQFTPRGEASDDGEDRSQKIEALQPAAATACDALPKIKSEQRLQALSSLSLRPRHVGVNRRRTVASAPHLDVQSTRDSILIDVAGAAPPRL
jgi:hypothetical protein